MTPATAVRRSPARDRALKLFVVLQRATNAINARIGREIDLGELTQTEFSILEALYHKGPLLLGDLQRKILLSSGGVTYTIDRLCDKGLVERRECPSDRRARYAALTPKGEALMDKLFPVHADWIEEAMTALSPKEQADVTAALRKLGLAIEGSSTE